METFREESGGARLYGKVTEPGLEFTRPAYGKKRERGIHASLIRVVPPSDSVPKGLNRPAFIMRWKG